MESVQHTMRQELPDLHNMTYNRSTLPHLLKEYGLKDQVATIQKQRKDVKKTKKMKEHGKSKSKQTTTYNFINAHDEKLHRKQTEKEEYYLKLVQDMYKLRDFYYKKYIHRLAQKLHKQQATIKEKDIQSKEKKEQREEEKRQANLKLKKRLEFNALETSSTAKNIPKTDLYHIVGLEQKLLREGKLKTMTDYNEFRLIIQDPQVFYNNFKVKKLSGGSTNPGSSANKTASHGQHSFTDLVLKRATTKQADDHVSSPELQLLKEDPKLRKLSRQNSWTQQYPAQFKMQASVPSLQIGKSKQEIQLDLDKRFPKVVMPKLHCFDMNLINQPPPDLDQTQQKSEIQFKEKHRKTLMRKVARMYQLALSNMATSTRILDKHKDIQMIFDGPELCDVIADKHWTQVFQLKGSQVISHTDNQEIFEKIINSFEEAESDDKEQQKAAEIQDNRETNYLVKSSRENSSASWSSQPDEDSHKSPSKLGESADNTELPLPLTLDEIKDKYCMVEAKSLSTFWVNYMGAGK